MSERQWIAFTDSAGEGDEAEISVTRDTTQMVTTDMMDVGHRSTVVVHYEPSGVWEGTLGDFTHIEMPGASIGPLPLAALPMASMARA